MLNLDLLPLFFFFSLYTVLEILIATTMEDYRLIETDEDQEDLEDEEEEEEEADDEEEEYDEGEEVAELIPAARMIPIGSIEDDDYDDEDDGEDYEDEYDDYDDDDDEDDDEEEDYEDEDEDYYEDDEVEELIPVEMPPPSASRSVADGRSLQGAVMINNGVLDHSSDLESRGIGNEELNRGEIDGLICPICFEAWTSGGEHQICCLPCGHIFGLSCIMKWLQLRPSSKKCPQCKGLCKLKDVRVLYAARLCVADEELHKKVQSLEAKCAYLEQKDLIERIKEELREELKQDMDEKLQSLKREMEEKMEKIERDMQEIRMGNVFDEYVNRNRQRNVNLSSGTRES